MTTAGLPSFRAAVVHHPQMNQRLKIESNLIFRMEWNLTAGIHCPTELCKTKPTKSPLEGFQ